MRMAMAETPIREICPELLSGRLLFALDNWLTGEIPATRVEQFRLRTPEAVDEYFANGDHGYWHSCAVYERTQEIMAGSPQMVRLMIKQESLSAEQIGWVMVWASMFHDLMRFFGYGTPDHEAPAAELARSAFWKDAAIGDALVKAVIFHDYLSPIIDGKEAPLVLLESPLADIFRLADKTSVSPEEEINRWWLCGQRYQTKFFDEELTDPIRFNLPENHNQRDQVTFFLMLFALQAQDFYSGEARQFYQEWSDGKIMAYRRILSIARSLPIRVSERKIAGVFKRFFWSHSKNGLRLPPDWESVLLHS